MIKKIISLTLIILFSLLICKLEVSAETQNNFILPKSFKVNEQTNKTVQTKTIQTKPVVKTVPVVKQEPPKTQVSLENLVKNYKNSYADTLKSTIVSLNMMGIKTTSYNTQKGQIIAKLPSGKEIFVLIVPFSENQTSIRITPANGEYNLPMDIINEIFSAVEDNLHTI